MFSRQPKPGAMSAAERMRRMRERRRAAGLKPVVTWVRRVRIVCPPPLDLRLIEARALALHVLAARKIEDDPDLLEVAHRRLASWRQRGSGQAGDVIRQWRKVLARPWPEIAALMTEQSEAAVRLRHTTPFTGVLTPRERQRLHAAFRRSRKLL